MVLNIETETDPVKLLYCIHIELLLMLKKRNFEREYNQFNEAEKSDWMVKYLTQCYKILREKHNLNAPPEPY